MRTRQFPATYKARAGVEGTIAQAACSCPVRYARYVGEQPTHLQHLMVAAAINLVRILRWLAGEPKTATRPSALALLYQPVIQDLYAHFATSINLLKTQFHGSATCRCTVALLEMH
jgi:hypothetical protein